MGPRSPRGGGGGPAGCPPVTKEIVVINLTPFSGGGLALLYRLPVIPEHNPCVGHVGGGTVGYGVSPEYMDQDATFGSGHSARSAGYIDDQRVGRHYLSPFSGCGLALLYLATRLTLAQIPVWYHSRGVRVCSWDVDWDRV